MEGYPVSFELQLLLRGTFLSKNGGIDAARKGMRFKAKLSQDFELEEARHIS